MLLAGWRNQIYILVPAVFACTKSYTFLLKKKNFVSWLSLCTCFSVCKSMQTLEHNRLKKCKKNLDRNCADVVFAAVVKRKPVAETFDFLSRGRRLVVCLSVPEAQSLAGRLSGDCAAGGRALFHSSASAAFFQRRRHAGGVRRCQH